MSNYREVSQQEFFAIIGPGNNHPTPEGKYPYTSVFRNLNTRAEVGRIVEFFEPAISYPPKAKYLVVE